MQGTWLKYQGVWNRSYCMICTKCWHDAFVMTYQVGGHLNDNYMQLLQERKDKPCTLQEQAGAYWIDGWDTRESIDIRGH